MNPNKRKYSNQGNYGNINQPRKYVKAKRW